MPVADLGQALGVELDADRAPSRRAPRSAASRPRPAARSRPNSSSAVALALGELPRPGGRRRPGRRPPRPPPPRARAGRRLGARPAPPRGRRPRRARGGRRCAGPGRSGRRRPSCRARGRGARRRGRRAGPAARRPPSDLRREPIERPAARLARPARPGRARRPRPPCSPSLAAQRPAGDRDRDRALGEVGRRALLPPRPTIVSSTARSGTSSPELLVEALDHRAQLELRRHLAQPAAVGLARAIARVTSIGDLDVVVQGRELLRDAGVVGVLGEVLLALRARDLVDVVEHLLQRAELAAAAGPRSCRRSRGRRGCCRRCRP